MPKRKRKSFRRWGFVTLAHDGEFVTGDGYIPVFDSPDSNWEDIPVEVREVLPPCKHELAVEEGDNWCRECGSYRQYEGLPLGCIPRWRKPRRAL